MKCLHNVIVSSLKFYQKQYYVVAYATTIGTCFYEFLFHDYIDVHQVCNEITKWQQLNDTFKCIYYTVVSVVLCMQIQWCKQEQLYLHREVIGPYHRCLVTNPYKFCDDLRVNNNGGDICNNTHYVCVDIRSLYLTKKSILPNNRR